MLSTQHAAARMHSIQLPCMQHVRATLPASSSRWLGRVTAGRLAPGARSHGSCRRIAGTGENDAWRMLRLISGLLEHDTGARPRRARHEGDPHLVRRHVMQRHLLARVYTRGQASICVYLKLGCLRISIASGVIASNIKRGQSKPWRAEHLVRSKEASRWLFPAMMPA